MKLNTNLRKILNRKDITVAQLARATRISKNTIQDWISGTSPRDLSKLKEVAQYLGTTIDDLLFGASEIPQKPLTQTKEIDFGNFAVILRPLDNRTIDRINNFVERTDKVSEAQIGNERKGEK